MKDYRKKGEESWDLAWRLLHTDGWKLEAGKQDAKTGSVHSLRFPHVGKIFRLEVSDLVLQRCLVAILELEQ